MVSLEDCGIMLEPQFGMSPAEVVSAAVSSEELGFGHVFRSDHLLATDGREGLSSPECWTTLGAIAVSTSKIRFGPLVTPVGFRNPALLGRMAATVGGLSEGRLVLALGGGWYEPEFQAHGYPFQGFKERIARLRESVAIVNAVVNEGAVDFEGRYFTVKTEALPKPGHRTRVIVGGKSPSTVRVAASMADEWNFLVSQKEDFRKLKVIFDEATKGRNVKISEMGPFMIGRSESELLENASRQVRKFGLNLTPQDLLKRIRSRNAPCGTVADFVQQVGEKLDSGIQRFYFQALVPENVDMTTLLRDSLGGA